MSPGGEYGTSSAANVATNMLRTFPHIRIGLMVGIGGGAPSREHDIRLGDVVVSLPSNGNGGVLQYDFGKTIQDRTFCTTGFLDQPPAVLRAAVSRLQAQYEMHGHCLNEEIDRTLQNWPKLNRKKYGRPDVGADRLYRADIVHDDQNCCEAATDDNTLNLISRHPRTQDTPNPAIHYGLIGSANQMMKDALVRDRLSKERRVLCFEMEAAGLMNHFPCLVIRGICNYSDSHKNKEWQGYAAMVAAAYAKDLLCQIRPDKVLAEKRIDELVLASVSRIEKNVEVVRSNASRENDLSILNWISSVDYGPQQSDVFNIATPRTGRWTATLFYTGMPDAGETVLTSIIIKDLSDRFRNNTAIGIAYIYFNFRRQEEQTLEALKSSLLKQLSERQSSLPEYLRNLYQDHEETRTRPSSKELSEALDLALAAYSRVYVVIDALDECDTSNGCRDRFLSEIFRIQSSGRVSILATSRDNLEIQCRFEGSAVLEIRAAQDDVRKYLDDHMSELPAFTRISRAADGMFLLAQLYLESLKGRTTFRAVRRALEALVTGSNAYEHAYDRAMRRINRRPREEADLAKRILSWITFARRPLVTEELRHALSVEIGTSYFDKENLLQVDMVSMCAGLVTIDKESNIIRLVHYTTQQYFEKPSRPWVKNPHLDITETCLTYLSFQSFNSGFAGFYTYKDRLESNPFYAYASVNWGHHARLGPACQDVLPFLRKQNHVQAAGQALLRPRADDPLHFEYFMGRITGLHLAAYFGLKQLLLASGADIEGKNSMGRTPLMHAIDKGHKTIIQLLLTKGANIETKNRWGQTPLLFAIRRGREAVIRLFLASGANIEAKDDNGVPPLLYAAKNGHEAAVRLLLENGANTEAKDNNGTTPLLYAAKYGDEVAVRMLLANGADIKAQNCRSETSLQLAAKRGHIGVARLLVNYHDDETLQMH
ncbi:hypothetical protein F5Y10DRAFT_279158 [Nemania abortiva]|nr:hypothetical protein F5Y10DRAFT_279158 [Nemania abortiva]